jgi:hypothetical protein
MKFYHVVINTEGNEIEINYSANDKFKFSMQCLAKIKSGTYKIFNRETHEMIIVPSI